MKMIRLIACIVACLAFFLMPGFLAAQEERPADKKEVLKVKKRTIMERYEPGLVLSPEERLQLKRARLATIKKRRSIIDTLDISDRKRRRLLKELYRSPLSNRWDKVVADLTFEQEPDY